ncbi:MAG TPA: DUF1015 family protein [Rhodothermales bacterium]|nr:DUF1015 family protein [Rhodothermales bacterium]
MATIYPFRALRPVPGKATAVASVPYDVINTEEARQLAQGKPDSFLHIIRPEIALPSDIDEHADAVYEKGAANLRAYAKSGISLQEATPALYVYRIVMGGWVQTGLFGCVAVSEYDEGTILKHENTRPVKEDDRTRHILAQQAHAEPVMLTYRDDDEIDTLIEAVQEQESLYDFEAEDGVRHTVWKADDPQALVKAFARIDKLYIADGHHRCKAASRAAEELRGETGRRGEAEYEYFPAVLFPMGQMHIMSYNRLVYHLPKGKEAFLNELRQRFTVEDNVADPTPNMPGEICLYLGDHWHRLELPDTQRSTVADTLDVARLGEYLLEPILGIHDARTDDNVNFVGGIRGTEELEKLVDRGEADLAISMHPTQIEELVAVSDAGLLMPPKSTWFEPKLRSGLLVHLFE